jgi:hypothetical protein
VGVALHLDDHDAALRGIGILFLGLFLCLRATPLVTHRDLEARALLTAPFFLFPASDLFDDPRFEHGESPSLHACNISSY